LSPRSLAPAVEKAVHDLDPDLPIARMATMDEIVARSISEPRFYSSHVVVLRQRCGSNWWP